MNFFTTTSSITFTQCAPEATAFGEITQNKGHYAVQGHSRSPFLYQSKPHIRLSIVINTNLPLILHRFWNIAYHRSKIAIFGYPSLFNLPPPPRWRGSLHHIIISDISLKTRSFQLHFCRREFRYIFNDFYAVRPESYQIHWNNAK